MSAKTPFEEFSEYSSKINEINNNNSMNLALAIRSANNDLFENVELKQYIQTMNTAQQELQRLFPKLLTIGASAFQNINNNVGEIKDQVMDLQGQMDDMNEQTNNSLELLQQTISTLQSTIKELTLMNKTQSVEIKRLRDMLSLPNPSATIKDTAKFIIDNCKNNQGKSIKGASITIDNVSAILIEYDKLKEDRPDEQKPTASTNPPSKKKPALKKA